MSTKGIHPSDQGIMSYIGDSVYALGDRHCITLRLDHHENPIGQIVLDHSTLVSLKRFIAKWEAAYGH